jgi:hypothetical protein
MPPKTVINLGYNSILPLPIQNSEAGKLCSSLDVILEDSSTTMTALDQYRLPEHLYVIKAHTHQFLFHN